MIKGQHLIAGYWLGGTSNFNSSPASGPVRSFADGTAENVAVAARAAEEAFASYGYGSRQMRAQFLNTVADEIDLRGSQITEIGCEETGLPGPRMEMERGRTVGQLRLFAQHILDGDYLDRRFDEALPDRSPLPRPDLRMMQRPVGPVAVFGASNFPLAFSTAGGDTAAALAAGCPVIVKGHPAHPGTGEIVAQAIDAAIQSNDIDPGVFSFIHSSGVEAGTALVQHPSVCAVGFTGSLRGGRALFDLCASRPVPIPFFGELGSVNPMFLLPEAMKSRAAEIGTAWAGSLTMGVGQFCTNPGIAIVLSGFDCEAFVEAAKVALSKVDEQVMLTDGIAAAFQTGSDRLRQSKGVRQLIGHSSDGRRASPHLFVASATTWLEDEVIGEEVFGPLGVVVVADSLEEMHRLAMSLQGQLTATLHMDDADTAAAKPLIPILERKAGRILVNGFPTGVEVASSMVHGGPYPASTNFGATSVGTLSIRRFLRPICYQNLPDTLLPEDICDGT